MTTTAPIPEVTLHVDVAKGYLLTANQRGSWAKRYRIIHHLRGLARMIAPRNVVLEGRQRCVVAVQWPDRRRRDVANIHPTVKALIDGCVDAGLLTDDSDRHLVGPDLRVSDELCGPRLACHLTVHFSPEERP